MDQISTRIRKAFRYATENDYEDDLPEAIDEEEQEKIIIRLHQEHITRNKQYATILLALPLLSLIPYLPTLFTPRLTLLSILSITSLLSTLYTLYFFPPTITGIAFLDALNTLPLTQPESRAARLQRLNNNDDGPMKQYLPLLNLGLSVVLIGLGNVVSRKVDIWWGFGWLPASVYAVVLVAKWVMRSVDPEAELGELKYGFKGA